MKTRVFLLMLIIFLLVASASASVPFSRGIYNYCRLTSTGDLADSSTASLPNGTVWYVVWDQNSNGPDAADTVLAPLSGTCHVNYNQGTINSYQGRGGAFHPIINYSSYSCNPTPNRYYLRICVEGTGRWESSMLIDPSGPAYWRLYSADWTWTSGTSSVCGDTTSGEAYPTSANPLEASPNVYALNANYPNPFNPTTTISYSLKEAGQVTLRVFDLSGRITATLVNGFETAGSKSVTFDGSGLASGIYYYTLTSGNFTATNKMVLMK